MGGTGGAEQRVAEGGIEGEGWPVAELFGETEEAVVLEAPVAGLKKGPAEPGSDAAFVLGEHPLLESGVECVVGCGGKLRGGLRPAQIGGIELSPGGAAGEGGGEDGRAALAAPYGLYGLGRLCVGVVEACDLRAVVDGEEAVLCGGCERPAETVCGGLDRTPKHGVGAVAWLRVEGRGEDGGGGEAAGEHGSGDPALLDDRPELPEVAVFVGNDGELEVLACEVVLGGAERGAGELVAVEFGPHNEAEAPHVAGDKEEVDAIVAAAADDGGGDRDGEDGRGGHAACEVEAEAVGPGGLGWHACEGEEGLLGGGGVETVEPERDPFALDKGVFAEGCDGAERTPLGGIGGLEFACTEGGHEGITLDGTVGRPGEPTRGPALCLGAQRGAGVGRGRVCAAALAGLQQAEGQREEEQRQRHDDGAAHAER